MKRLTSAMLVSVLIVASSASAQDVTTQMLLLGESGFTAIALDALDVPHDTASFADLSAQRVNLFRYGVVISGMDADRASLDSDSARLLAFVRNGGVFIGMRFNNSDQWLPSAVKRDKAYHLGEILAPDHPMFTTPNEISNETIADVHSGSIYDAFWNLGEGWVGLVSAGPAQEWDKREADSEGDHYGIIELAYGEGRIILCQMIPEYDWFKDRGGEDGPGKLLLQNMIAYALACGPDWSSIGSETPVPDAYHTDLSEFLSPPDAAGNWPLDGEGWSFEGEGQFSGKADRRSVYTLSHPNEPSVAGAFGRVQRTVKLGDAAGHCWLRFYESDDYCGGMDKTLVGDHLASQTENRKGDMRFAEVTVDGQIVWERDVLGLNPRPASRRFHTVDISELTRDKNRVTIALQVTDRQGSDDAPFATDVFWAGVELLTGIERVPASALTVEGFALDGESIALGEGVTGGVATTPAISVAGKYHLAVRLLDESTGRSKLVASVGGKRVGALTMTADDWGWRWAVFGPTRIPRGGRITLRARRDGSEAVRISEVTLLPVAPAEDIARRSGPGILPVCYQPGPQATRKSFIVTVADHAGVERADEIATHGLPFAYGALRSAENIRVLDPDGVEVPRQARGLNTWPDGSVMFALVNFPASVSAGQTAEYTIEYGSEVRAQARPITPARVTEDGETIRVETGPLTVTLNKTTGSIFESALLHGREMVAGGEPWAALITTEDGRVFSSATDSVTDAQVIEAGPIRVIVRRIGRHKAPDGATLFEYDLIQEFYAGSPITRLRYVFTHKEDSETERISRASLHMPLPWMKWGDASSASIWLDENSGVARLGGAPGKLAVNQYDLDAARVNVDGQDAAEAGRTRGWARVQDGPGLAVATRWWWQKFPKAIGIGPDGITLDLIPEGSHTVFSDGPFVQYQGEAIGHEIMIAFEAEGADAEDEAVFRAFGDRLLATPDPAYACGTMALGETAPTNRRMFPRYEDQVNRMYESYLAKREKRREFGMENFGDDTFEWGYGPVYTFWSNQEYDHQHGFLMQYLRSGDRDFFEIGEQAARHQEQVDCVHWAGGNDYRIGSPHHHNSKHLVDEGWFPDHCVKPGDVTHAWLEGLYDYWLMTGDVRAGEMAREMSDWFAWSVENNHFGAGGQERGPGWSLIALSSAYRLTGEERYRRAAETIVDWFEGMVDPVRGVISVPISEQPSYEGGTVFMHGIVGRGLGKYYEATSDPRGMIMALNIGEWITTEPMGPPARFWYKQAPDCKHGFSATSQVMTSLSYPYRYTGDKWFANMSEALFAQTGPSVRSAAWYYTSLAHLASLRSPLRIEMPDGPTVIAPGNPWHGIVKLTNTTGNTLTTQLTGESEGLSATFAPTSPTLASGESLEVTLEISANAGTVGARELTLRLISGEQMQERALLVRIVPEMVRLEMSADEATLVAPFALGRDGARTFAHVPPEVRANDGPWQPEDETGSSTWRIKLPVAGEYVLMAECWWRDGKGNSLYAQIDGGEPMTIGNTENYGHWLWVKTPTLELNAGEHTIAVLGREDGARVSQVMLTNVGG